MVVSVKSILFDDVSGEGKMTDYSNQGWPVSNKFTNTNTTVGKNIHIFTVIPYNLYI